MTQTTADIVICGAGIAGISAAYYLSVNHGIKNVVIVDERPPLTLTSDKSSECYRNWWPGPGDTMVQFMNHSIDLLEGLAHETGNAIQLNRRGYIFLTADKARGGAFKEAAAQISDLGAGPLRIHAGQPNTPTYTPSPAHGFENQPTGADLLLDPDLIRSHYPFVSDRVVAALHVRRCGWFSAQQLGMNLLEQAKAHGAILLRGTVERITRSGGRVQTVHIRDANGETHIDTDTFIIAAGPFLNRVGALLEVELPVFNELHAKIAFRDRLGVVPRDVPMMIWSDPVHLPWSEEEQEELAESEETRWLLEEFPGGVHFRPEGDADSPILLMLWTYDTEVQEPVQHPEFDPAYPEIVLRGLTHMIPELSAYLGKMGRPYVDGGYYCKTRENRPLIGPLPVEGAYVIGAVSGFGLMASLAAGELLAAHVTSRALPEYAPAFLLSRYEDPEYQKLLENWDATSGQL